MRFYRVSSLILAGVFAGAGFCFLLIPADVISFFNNLGEVLHMPPAPVHGAGFYGILACAYMVMVTALALLMARHPSQYWFPRLLSLAKAASALLSLGMVLAGPAALIYLANGILDGAIGLFVLAIASRNPEIRP